MDYPRRAVRARAAEDAGLPAGGRFFFTEPAGQYEDELENEKELLELRVLLLKMDALLQLQYITAAFTLV